jgi:S-formylglutathione hydrolase FrmB
VQPWRWWWRWLAIATVASDMAAGCARRRSDPGGLGALVHRFSGLAGDPAPSSLWIWVGLTGIALAVAVLGWRGSQWWRRSVSLLAVLLCLLSAGVSLNLWVGYFRTVQAAWNELTAGPLPDETDLNTVMAMRGKGAPAHGALVPVTIPDCGVRLQTPHRVGVSAACLVRCERAEAACGHDDRR